MEDHLICAAARGNERGKFEKQKEEKIRSISLSARKMLRTHRLLHVGQPADSVAAKKPAELGSNKDMERFHKDSFD